MEKNTFRFLLSGYTPDPLSGGRGNFKLSYKATRIVLLARAWTRSANDPSQTCPLIAFKK